VTLTETIPQTVWDNMSTSIGSFADERTDQPQQILVSRLFLQMSLT